MNPLQRHTQKLYWLVASGALLQFAGCGLSSREWAAISESVITSSLTTLAQQFLLLFFPTV